MLRVFSRLWLFVLLAFPMACDAGGKDINCVLLLKASAPDGAVGERYAFQFQRLADTGEDRNARVFSATTESGGLPPGLEFDDTGVLAGVPTEAGSFTFVALLDGDCTVEDVTSEAVGATGTYTIVIHPACPTITVVADGDLAPGTVGAVYPETNLVIESTLPITASLRVSEGFRLPPGLTLGSAGIVGGTPTVSGRFRFDVEFTDTCPGRATLTRTYVITIAGSGACPPLGSALASEPPPGFIDEPYTFTPAPTGGVAPYFISAAPDSGPLPPGIVFDATTDTFSGTPTAAGDFPVRLTIQDSCPEGTQTLDVDITLSILTTCPFFAIDEAPAPPPGEVSTVYAGHQFTVTGGFPPVTFALDSGALPPGLTLSATGQLSGTPTTEGTFPFTVLATDSCPTGVKTSPGAFSITIAALSCTPLEIVGGFETPDGQVGEPYPGHQLLVTSSEGAVTWVANNVFNPLPPGLTLSADGLISGVPTTPGFFQVFVLATDSCGVPQTRSKDILIIVNDGPCQFLDITVPTTPPAGRVGEAYSFTPNILGGQLPFTLRLAAGSSPQPPGLTFNSATRRIEGIPTTPGSFTFVLEVLDSCPGAQQTDEQNYTILINAGCLPLGIDEGAIPPNGQVDVAYPGHQFQLLAGQTGVNPVTWSVVGGEVPPGTTLAADGQLTGTPTSAGTFPFTLRATDSCAQGAQTDEASFSITILAACPSVGITGIPPFGQTDVPYSFTYGVAGGIAPFTFALTAGTPPPGLTLSATGQWSGTPTLVGSFPVTVQVTDSCVPAPQTFSVDDVLVITQSCDPLAIDESEVPPDGRVDEVYSHLFDVLSGQGPVIQWQVSAGTLPPGLTLDALGLLSGTPFTPGTFDFTVTAQDGCTPPQTDTFAVQIEILDACALLDLAPATPVVGEEGVNYLFVPPITGGEGTVTLSLNAASGPLPAGVGIVGTTITGTPTENGTFPITLDVTDQCTPTPQTDSQAYTIVINPPTGCPTLNVVFGNPPIGTVGVFYTFTIPVTGGVAPITITLNESVGSPLPPGLTLVDGVVSGVPTLRGFPNCFIEAVDSCDPTPQFDGEFFNFIINDP